MVVELDEASAERVAERAEEFAELGLVIEPFGPGALVVREEVGSAVMVSIRGPSQRGDAKT